MKRIGARLFRGHDRALMIENAPTLSRHLPNGRASSDAFTLAEGVSQKVGIRTKAAKPQLVALPVCRGRVDRPILLQRPENELSAVTTAGRAHFPVIGC